MKPAEAVVKAEETAIVFDAVTRAVLDEGRIRESPRRRVVQGREGRDRRRGRSIGERQDDAPQHGSRSGLSDPGDRSR